MTLLEQYKELHPTQRKWVKYKSDAKYVWDGQDLSVYFLTPGEQDSDFLIWVFDNISTIMQMLANEMETKKLLTARAAEIESLKDVIGELAEKESKVCKIVQKITTGNLLDVDEAIKEFKSLHPEVKLK